jgi:hypothetical protein
MMDAILFSADPKRVDVKDARKHLSQHKELYWSVGYPIDKSRFKFPIEGFIHINGDKVQYKSIIKKIIPFSPDHFNDPVLAQRVKPKTFRQEWERNPQEGLRRSRTVLVMTKITPYSINTKEFKIDNDKRGKVTRPPQRYYRVISPPLYSKSRRAKPVPGNKGDNRRPDQGPKVKFTKEGHSADPQHAKIVTALVNALTKDRWSFGHPFKCQPDVLATKERERLLFEVKPDSSNASFYMGLGQLLLYRREVRECQSFLVIPEESLEDRLNEEWRSEFKEREIGFVTYKRKGEQYYFPKLAVQLRA